MQKAKELQHERSRKKMRISDEQHSKRE